MVGDCFSVLLVLLGEGHSLLVDAWVTQVLKQNTGHKALCVYKCALPTPPLPVYVHACVYERGKREGAGRQTDGDCVLSSEPC